MKKIVKNAIQCKLCGACSVDGGHEYRRIGCKSKDCFIDLSVTEAEE